MTATRPHLLGVLAGLFLAVGLVCSSLVVARAWLRISESQTVSVTGSARKAVQADLAVWRGQFVTESGTLLAAQRALKADLAKVEAFLQGNGITNYAVAPISIQELRGRVRGDADPAEQKTTGYRLSQGVQVSSPEVARISLLDRDSSALVEQGVVFTTAPLEFIYTRAGEAKVEMLAEATKDARARAEQIAAHGGRSIHQLRAAKMGVFQITPLHSLQTHWEGVSDTTSLEKTITAVISASFSLR